MNIDRASLRHVLSQLPFEPGRWVVAGSAPMLMAGIIDSISDIDLVVDGISWEDALSLSDAPPIEGLHGDHMVSIRVDDAVVELFDGWLGTGAEVIIAESVEVDGYWMMPLGRVLDSKRRLSRQKDADHIVALEGFLRNGPTAKSQEPAASSQQPPPD